MGKVFNLGIIAAIIGLLTVVGIGIQAGQIRPTESRRILHVSLVLGQGGLGDRAFNDSAYAGLQRAQRELGTRFRVVEYVGGEGQIPVIRHLAQEKPDLIIALGFENVAALETVAAEYPAQRFAIIDTQANGSNITSVTFCEAEGDFLAGALSALLSTNGTVGYLGGAGVPVIYRIEESWQKGVHYINPQAIILSEYIGGEGDYSGFAKPELGMELTTAMYQQGADIVYAAAGGSVLGAIEAAKNENQLIITTGSDQRWIAQGVVVTSRTKNMDIAVYDLIVQLLAGDLKTELIQFDYRSNGVGFAPLSKELVPDDVMKEFETVKNDLSTGKINIELECQP